MLLAALGIIAFIVLFSIGGLVMRNSDNDKKEDDPGMRA